MANSFVNKKVDLTSTSATTLYTVPAYATAVIKSILVSDDSGSGDTITITITDTDDAVFSLFHVKSISASGTSELLSAPIVAKESEVIKVTAATANRLHVVLSALEIKPRDVTWFIYKKQVVIKTQVKSLPLTINKHYDNKIENAKTII